MKRARAFTLTELLVVLVILGLLAALVAPRLMGGVLGGAKSKTAATQIQSLASAVEIYRLDVGRYPTTQEGLAALVTAPSAATGWAGPYLSRKTLPKDPWSEPYRYESGDDGESFRIVTFGADRKEGGDGENADIASDQ